MDRKTMDYCKLLEAVVSDAEIMLKASEWKSIYQFDVIQFFMSDTVGACGSPISFGDSLQLKKDDDFTTVMKRIKVLLRQYMPEKSIPDKVIFALSKCGDL